MAIKIVTDSTADIPQDIALGLGISTVPVYVMFTKEDGAVESLRDGPDISHSEFYERLEQSESLPTTSQPTPEDFGEVYDTLLDHPDGLVVSIHVSSKLSGTFNSALQAKRNYKEPGRIEVVDSGSVSMGLGLVVIAAARVTQNGGSINDVAEEIERAKSEVRTYFVLESLEHLQRGGRIGGAQKLLGSMLSLKPILTVDNGEVKAHQKVRSRRRALHALSQIADRTGKVTEGCVMYNTTPIDAESVSNDLKRLLRPDRLSLARIGCGIGVHTGPGTVGVAFRAAS